MKKRVLFLGLALAALAVTAALAVYEPAERVETASVRFGDMALTAQAEGGIIAREDFLLTAAQAGQVEELSLESGQIVEPGQIVLRLSDGKIREEIAAIDARMQERAQETVAPAAEEETAAMQAETALREAAGLAQTRGISYDLFNRTVEAAFAARSSAVFASVLEQQTQANPSVEEAEQEKLKSWRTRLEGELETLELSTAQGGKVLEVFAKEGDYLLAGEKIARLTVPEGGLVQVQGLPLSVGQKVRLTVQGVGYEGNVCAVESGKALIEPQSGLYERAVQSGGGVTVSAVSASAQDVCLLPRNCVAEDEAGAYVLLLDSGRLRRQDVTVVLENEVDAAVSAGLGAGEVAVYYPERYLAGQKAVAEE